MKQKEIDWQYDDDCQEWTGKLSIFEFSVEFRIPGWAVRLTEPEFRNFTIRHTWSTNGACDKFDSDGAAKKKCEEYISDRLSEMTVD